VLGSRSIVWDIRIGRLSVEAAIGCAELETYRANIAARRANAGVLTAQLQYLPLQLPKERVAGEHVYMMYPIVCLGDDRDALIQHLESNGIETRPMLPLTSQPYLKKLMGDDVEDRYPVAKWINQQGFYVGSHPYLTESDLAYMSDTFPRILSWLAKESDSLYNSLVEKETTD